ncbi:MAG: ABC transporter permease [Acidobacteriaceae bacterium]
MFWTLLLQSFLRQRRRKLLAGLAITLGIAVSTGMLAVGTDVGDKMSRELRAYGANILVTPAVAALDTSVDGVPVAAASDAQYLNESDLPRIKGIFWRHNVTGFSPELVVSTKVLLGGRVREAPVIGTWFNHPVKFGDDEMVTGWQKTHSWATVDGRLPQDGADEVAVGAALAKDVNISPGMAISAFGRDVKVTGIVSTGGMEDRAILAPIRFAQDVIGHPGAVMRVYVSALTKPEDDFARKNPDALSAADKDRWFCSPYANSVARQIQDTIPNSHAEQIRRVAQNEGTVLNRISGLMWLLSVGAQIAAAMAVSAAMATALYERRREIGLMKALGADTGRMRVLFFSEAVVLALVSGVVGYALGAVLARSVGEAVFGSPVMIQPILLPFVLIAACLVTVVGSAHAIWKVSSADPVLALRGEA